MNERSTRSALHELQTWYAGNCNGEWEHSYGVRIDTLDNPGWSVTIDLIGTPWAGLMSPIRTLDKSETDWLHTKIEEGRFVGNGGPFNLEQIIREFLRLIEGKKAA